MKDEIPDSLPDSVTEDLANDLMNRIQAYCNESTLTPIEIIGALEGVKFSYLWNKFKEITDDEEEP